MKQAYCGHIIYTYILTDRRTKLFPGNCIAEQLKNLGVGSKSQVSTQVSPSEGQLSSKSLGPRLWCVDLIGCW